MKSLIRYKFNLLLLHKTKLEEKPSYSSLSAEISELIKGLRALHFNYQKTGISFVFSH